MGNYTYRFAGPAHQPLKNLRDLRSVRWEGGSLGLYYKGQLIGEGNLYIKNFSRGWVNTDCVSLRKRFRRKGHGIFLYKALIQAARGLGAKSVYSSNSLNKKSRRMWSKKLPEYGYKVKSSNNCRSACKHCSEQSVFHIVLRTK